MDKEFLDKLKEDFKAGKNFSVLSREYKIERRTIAKLIYSQFTSAQLERLKIQRILRMHEKKLLLDKKRHQEKCLKGVKWATKMFALIFGGPPCFQG